MMMIESIPDKTKSNPFAIWFTMTYAIMLVYDLLEASTLINPPEVMSKLLLLISLGMCGLLMIHQSYAKVGLLIVGTVGLLVAVNYVTATYFIIVMSFVLMCSSQNMVIKDTIKISVLIKSIVLGSHIVLYYFALIMNPHTIEMVYRETGEARFTYFFGHPNTFSAIVIWLSFEIIYLIQNRSLKIQWVLITLLSIANVFFYKATDSNTPMIILVVFIIFKLMNDVGLFKIIDIVCRWLFTVLSLVFLVLIFIYNRLGDSSLLIWKSLNKVFNGRIMYGAMAYDMHGLTFFGAKNIYPQKIYWQGFWVDEVIFDNTYIWLLVNIGAVFLIIFMLLIYFSAKKMSSMEKVFVICWCVYAVMEQYVMSATFSFPLLLMSHYGLVRKSERALEMKNPLYKLQLGSMTKQN